MNQPPAQAPRVLLTGAAGFVGRAVAQYLQSSGFAVTGCDLQGAEVVLDVLDTTAYVRLAQQLTPHAIVHAAALTSGSDLQLLQVNLGGTLSALAAAQAVAVPHLVLFSSAGVYAPHPTPVNESGPTTTAHAYGVSKLLAEQACVLAKPAATSLWMLRLAAIYGPGETPSPSRQRPSLLYEMAQVLRGEREPMFSRSPQDPYNFLHTHDLGRFLAHILHQTADGQSRLYNLGGPTLSAAELWQHMAQQAHHPQPTVAWNPTPTPRNGALDCSKAAREMGFVPQVPLAQGLRDYWPQEVI